MCHTIALHGGVADGEAFTVHGTPPRALVVWHEDHDELTHCSIEMRDFDNFDRSEIPDGADVVVYRRRYEHVLRLHLVVETVVPLPYDLVREPADQRVPHT